MATYNIFNVLTSFLMSTYNIFKNIYSERVQLDSQEFVLIKLGVVVYSNYLVSFI